MTAALMVWEGHVLELELDRTRAPRSMLGIGVGHGAAYWWSARHLVVVPTEATIHEIFF